MFKTSLSLKCCRRKENKSTLISGITSLRDRRIKGRGLGRRKRIRVENGRSGGGRGFLFLFPHHLPFIRLPRRLMYHFHQIQSTRFSVSLPSTHNRSEERWQQCCLGGEREFGWKTGEVVGGGEFSSSFPINSPLYACHAGYCITSTKYKALASLFHYPPHITGLRKDDNNVALW